MSHVSCPPWCRHLMATRITSTILPVWSSIGCSTLAYICLPWVRRLLQGAAYSFPSQPQLLAVVGRSPLIVWPLCPAYGPLVGVGWHCPLAPRGGRWAGPREGPLLFEFLERPDPYTVGHTSPKDGGSFDRLEQFLLRGAVLDGPAHVGHHTILEAPRRQDAHHHEFFHFDGQRALLAHTEAPDFGPGGGVGWIELRGPVHFRVAIGILHVLRRLCGLRRHASS